MIIRINDNESKLSAIKESINIINNGGVIISPTDTVYGFLADAFNIEAVQKIYNIKKRDNTKPLIILLKDINEVRKFSDYEIPEIIKSKLPNEITFIMPLKKELKNQLFFLQDTVALRIPKDEYINSILQQTNPLVAPSANPSDYGVIYDSSIIINFFKEDVDLIVDAGVLEKKQPSTLYDCINNKILRQGNVKL